MGPGDMKSLMVEEMSILWSAIGRKVLKGLQEDTYFFLNTFFFKICFVFNYGGGGACECDTRGRMRLPLPLELELQAVMSCPMCVLGTELGSLERQHEPSHKPWESYLSLLFCGSAGAVVALRSWAWLTTVASPTGQLGRQTGPGTGRSITLILRALICNP